MQTPASVMITALSVRLATSASFEAVDSLLLSASSARCRSAISFANSLGWQGALVPRTRHASVSTAVEEAAAMAAEIALVRGLAGLSAIAPRRKEIPHSRTNPAIIQ